MTSFYVNHWNHESVTAILHSAVSSMGGILDHLNGVLRHMDEAVSGQASPLWAEQQQQWTIDYEQMKADLTGGTTATMNIGQTFLDGDSHSAKIMM
jgi:hypothetical protein